MSSVKPAIPKPTYMVRCCMLAIGSKSCDVRPVTRERDVTSGILNTTTNGMAGVMPSI